MLHIKDTYASIEDWLDSLAPEEEPNENVAYLQRRLDEQKKDNNNQKENGKIFKNNESKDLANTINFLVNEIKSLKEVQLRQAKEIASLKKSLKKVSKQ